MNTTHWRVISTDRPNQIGYQYIGPKYSYLIVQTRTPNTLKPLQITVFITEKLNTPLSSRLAIGILKDLSNSQTYFFTQEIFLDEKGKIKPVFKSNNIADDDKERYPNIIGLKLLYPWLNEALIDLLNKVKKSSLLNSKDFYTYLLDLIEDLASND